MQKGVDISNMLLAWERKKNRAKEIRHRESWRDREGDVKEVGKRPRARDIADNEIV